MIRNLVQSRCFSFKKIYNVGTVGAVDEAHLSPKEIVKFIDSYVIGQADAKREVAVALRERWRRLQLPDDKAEEITPKNMLMSGPSGCGKTEIIRRVSKLLNAPFVKCDASTFTRRGVVGANVSDMIVDLYDAGKDSAKRDFRKQIKDVAKMAALDILTQCVYEDVLELQAGVVAAGEQVHEPQPATPSAVIHNAPPHMSSEHQAAILSAISEKLSAAKGALPVDAMYVVQDIEPRRKGVRKPSTVQPANTTTGSSSSADTSRLEEVLGKTKEELRLMGETAAKAYIREKLAELAQVTEDPYVLNCSVMHQKLYVEPGDADASLALSTEGKSGGGVAFPQMLFAGMGGGQEDHPESGNIKEFLKWIEDKLMSLMTSYRFHPSRSPVKELVEKWGIVCIDEIDKVVGKKGGGGGQDRWMNTDVQQELLTLVEGTRVNIDSARDMKGGGMMLKMGGDDVEQTIIDTSHILFVCAGAFTLCKPSDMLVELLGRLPVRVTINSLTEDDLYKILTDTKYPMIDQQTDLFSTEGVKLTWEEDAVREIAKVAHTVNAETQNTGARVLASILRTVLSEYSYNADEHKDTGITITRAHVQKTTKKLLPTKELNTYVL